MTQPTFKITSAQTASNVVDITANALVGGKGISLTSDGTGNSMTGNLMDITFSGDHANNTGNLISLTSSGADSKTVALEINQKATVSPAIKLKNGHFSTDNDSFSEIYLLKGTQGTGVGETTGKVDFDLTLENSSTYFMQLSNTCF